MENIFINYQIGSDGLKAKLRQFLYLYLKSKSKKLWKNRNINQNTFQDNVLSMLNVKNLIKFGIKRIKTFLFPFRFYAPKKCQQTCELILMKLTVLPLTPCRPCKYLNSQTFSWSECNEMNESFKTNPITFTSILFLLSTW